MREQDKDTPYEEILKRRDQAVARFSLAHQRSWFAHLELEAAKTELEVVDRELATAFGLPGTRRTKIGDL